MAGGAPKDTQLVSGWEVTAVAAGHCPYLKFLPWVFPYLKIILNSRLSTGCKTKP